MRRNYVALIPAYKPRDYILTNILKQLKAVGFRIVVVDDGCGPDYAGQFRNFSLFATILTHTANQGKGAALKTGLSYIREHFDENSIVVTLDADGQHCVEDALKLCKLAEQLPDGLVLGSRDLKGNIPLRSWFGNTITRLIYYLSTGLRVYDTQSGLRAFHSKMLPVLLEISGERYEYEMNVLLEFARKKIPIHEMKIQTIYSENNASSHFNVMRDSYRIYKEILKFSAASFIGFLIDYILYSLLFLFTANLRLSNIGARIVSSVTNYTLNRRFVFKSNSSLVKSAIQYFLLAAVILFGNTVVLEILVKRYGIHQMIAKVFTEIIFFTLSWITQRSIIFRRRTKEDRGGIT